MRLVSKFYSCSFLLVSLGLLSAVGILFCLNRLKRKIAWSKSQLEMLSLIPGVQSTVWLRFPYQADLQPREVALAEI